MSPQNELPQPSSDNGYGSVTNQPNHVTGGVAPTQIQNPYQNPQQNAYQQYGNASVNPAYAPSKPKRGKKLLLLLAAVVGLCALGGGSAAAYYGYVLPNKPENVMLAAMANTFSDKLKSARFTGAVELSGESVPAELRGMEFDGEVSDSGAGALNLTLQTTIAKPKLHIAAPDDKSIFMKLSGISGIEELAKAAAVGSDYEMLIEQVAPTIKEVNDQWYEFDQSLLSEDEAAPTTPTLSPADMEKLATAYEQNRFVKIIETLPDELINNAEAKHYKVAMQKTELMGFVRSIKDIEIAGMKITDKQLAEFETELNKVDLSKYPADIWIDKKTKFLAQIQTTVQDADMTATVRVTLKDYNANISVEKPKDAKSLLELMGQFAPLTSSLSGTGLSGFGLDAGSATDSDDTTMSTTDSERKVDVNRIATALEAYYVNNGGYPSAVDLQNAAWVAMNLESLSPENFVDPNGERYDYLAMGTDDTCASPTTQNGKPIADDVSLCISYTLVATLDDGSPLTKLSLN